jgi:Flp pilus assembly protein TadG
MKRFGARRLWRYVLSPFARRSSKGQAVSELALALPLIMLVFFGVFEFGRLLQSAVTIDHAVNEAARLATTGKGYGVDREDEIEAAAREASLGISIDEAAGGNAPGYFHVSIRSSGDSADPAAPNDAGGANEFVRVEIYYNHPIVVKVFGDQVTYIALHSEALVVNERFARPTGVVGQLAPTPPPIWTPTPMPTVTVTPVPTAHP